MGIGRFILLGPVPTFAPGAADRTLEEEAEPRASAGQPLAPPH